MFVHRWPQPAPLVLLSVLMLARLMPGAENAIPEDVCVVEFTLPIESRLNVQGREYGPQQTETRSLRYTSLTPGRYYSIPCEVVYPSGATSQHKLLIRGGRRIRFARLGPNDGRPEAVMQTGHSDRISCVAISADGRYVLSGSDDNSVILWEVLSGRILRYFKGHEDDVNAVAFSSDSRFVLTGSDDNLAILWETETGKQVQTFSGHSGNVDDVRFSPDDRLVLTGSSDCTAVLWNAQTGAKTRTFALDVGVGRRERVRSTCFSPNGRHVITSSSGIGVAGKISLWNVATGQRNQSFGKYDYDVRNLSTSSDGLKVVAKTAKRELSLWNTQTGRCEKTIKYTADISDACFLPDDESLLIGDDDGTVVRWDLQTETTTQTYVISEQKRYVRLALSRNGRWFVTACNEQLAVWETETGRQIQSFDSQLSAVTAIAIGRNRRSMVIGSEDGSVALWDLFAGTVNRVFAMDELTSERRRLEVEAVALSDDCRQLLIGLGRSADTVLVDTASGAKLGEFPGGQHVAFLPHSPHIMTLDDRRVAIWELGKEEAVNRISMYRAKVGERTRDIIAVEDVDVGTGGRLLLVGDHGVLTLYTGENAPPPEYVNAGAILFDMANGHVVRQFPVDDVLTATAISPDENRVITAQLKQGGVILVKNGRENSITNVQGSNHRKITLWDARRGTQLKSFDGHTGPIESVSFSSNSREILTASDDGTAIFWNLDKGEPYQTYEGHSDEVCCAEFGPDETWIVTGSTDGTARLWDTLTGEELAVIQCTRGGSDWLVTTPDGLFDGSPAARTKLCWRIGNGLKVVPVDRYFQDFYYPGLLAALVRGERPLAKTEIGDQLPPRIRILFPERSGVTEEESVTIEALIEDRGGGIKAPFVKLNGNLYLIDEKPVSEGDNLKWQFTIPLIAGAQNEIEIHSATTDGKCESEPAKLRMRSEKPQEPPELYMVAVGISDYQDAQRFDLQCARNDAETLADLFQRQGGAFYGEGKVHVSTVLDEQATKAGIRAALQQVASQAKPRDVLVLSLAGHGKTIHQRYYFIPYEFQSGGEGLVDAKVREQALPHDELNEWIAGIPATKRILIYDTCQSGAALTRNALEYQIALESLARKSGCHIIAAAASTEDAQELPDIGHGALTYALMGGLGAAERGILKNRSAASSDGLVRVVDWFRFAQEHVPTLTKLSIGREQQVEFRSSTSDFPILPAKEKAGD